MYVLILLAALAGGYADGGIYYDGQQCLPLSGGTITGGIATSGVGTAVTGDVCGYDNNGVQCGIPLTDAAPDSTRLFGHSGAPIGSTAGNRTGSNLRLAAGIGARRGAMTAAQCAGDQITVTINGSTTPPVGGTGTEGAEGQFLCDGLSDAVCATNVAAWIDTMTGVSACAGAGCTLFTGVAGTWYVWRATDEPGARTITIATNDNNCANLVSGTSGRIVASHDIGFDAFSQRVYWDQDDDSYTESPSDDVVDTYTAGALRQRLAASLSSITTTTFQFTSMAQLRMPSLASDLTSGSCTAGDLDVDNGGVSVELCFCLTTNNWYCTTLVTASPMPVD